MPRRCRQKSVKALERAAATGEKRKEKGKRKPTGALRSVAATPRVGCLRGTCLNLDACLPAGRLSV